jgi:tRNA pseudouridine55 synthase
MAVTTETCVLNGVVVLDKPAGWTSHDAVAKLRRIARTKRVGHLGTLDPLATGVLPLVIGKATRLAQYYTKDRKAYEATIRFGYSTVSYDRDSEATSEAQPVQLDEAQLRQWLRRFVGPLEQMPPPVSAKKIDGVAAYKLVRENKPVELKPASVEVYSLELLELSGADIRVSMECSAGTYVRSIAHELGQLAGCGAFVQELRRTRSGEFTLDGARTLEQLQELADQSRLGEATLQGVDLLPRYPVEIVDAITEGQIRQGRDFRTSPFRSGGDSPYVRAINQAGEFVALGEMKLPHLYHPVLVF